MGTRKCIYYKGNYANRHREILYARTSFTSSSPIMQECGNVKIVLVTTLLQPNFRLELLEISREARSSEMNDAND